MAKLRNKNVVAVRQDSSGAMQTQTTAVVHKQPVMTSSPVPVTSQHRNGAAAAAGAGQSLSRLSSATADSMTFSRTTLYEHIFTMCSNCCELWVLETL